MIFSPYSLFTITLMSCLFVLAFVILTSYSGIIRRIPLSAVYVFLAATGLRLLIPVEIDRLSFEINSDFIMTKINDFMRNKIFAAGSLSFSIGNLFIAVWIAGILVRSVFVIAKYCRFRLGVKQLAEVHDEHILNTVDMICSQLGIKSRPRVLRIMSNCSPSEYGLFKQTIVLNGAQYTDEELYYILLHEITHYKLKNDAAKCFAELLKIIFWWNPAVYPLYSRIDKLMEIYTDLSVTKELTKSQKYSYLHCLYNVYKTINVDSISASAFASPIIGSARASEIEKRFEIIAKGRKTNIPICIFAVVLSLMCCAATVFVVFQPYYDIPAEDIPSEKIDINSENSYITKEGDLYILYHNSEVLIKSPNKEDVESFLKKEE